MLSVPVRAWLAALFFSTFACSAFGAIELPRNLTKENRLEALRIVGFGTSSKILSNPYPLGGYSGFEVGVAVENLPAEDLGRLGNRLSAPQQDVSYPKLSIGKGLYNDIDFFLHFTPYNRQDELAHWGGIVRWGFHQATFLPFNAAILVHMNNSNIGNQLTTRSYGADLIGGINVDNVALFAGVGVLEATGTFLGGNAGITDTMRMESETVNGLHTLVGANVRFANVFVAAQIDRYTLPVFSGKLGVRF